MRSGTATRSSRVTRKAVIAAARPLAVAATSMTLAPWVELDAGGELAAADLRDVALDPDPRAGRADGAADLHRGALDDGGVDRRRDA